MANRNFANAGRIYAMHVKPVAIDERISKVPGRPDYAVGLCDWRKQHHQRFVPDFVSDQRFFCHLQHGQQNDLWL